MSTMPTRTAPPRRPRSARRNTGGRRDRHRTRWTRTSHPHRVVLARYYDPTIGRFTATDPLADLARPATLDAYGYAGSSPVANSDPTGLLMPVGSGGTGDNTNGSVYLPDGGVSGGCGLGCPSPAPAGPPGELEDLDPLIDDFADETGVDKGLLSAILLHEGGNYYSWRWFANMFFELCPPGLGSLKCPGSVGIGGIQPGTAVEVQRRVFGNSISESQARDLLVLDDSFSVATAAGYLRLLMDDYGLTDNEQLFVSYAASDATIQGLKSVNFDYAEVAAGLAPVAVACGCTAAYDPATGISAGILETLLRRANDYWPSAVAKIPELTG